MTEEVTVYWPFPVPPPEKRANEMIHIVRFLESAHAAGFRPSKHLDLNYGAGSLTSRLADINYRGPHLGAAGQYRWEVILCDATDRVMHFWVGGFEHAGAAALRWLHGGTPEEVAAVVEGHVIRGRAEAITPQPVPVTPA